MRVSVAGVVGMEKQLVVPVQTIGLGLSGQPSANPQALRPTTSVVPLLRPSLPPIGFTHLLIVHLPGPRTLSNCLRNRHVENQDAPCLP